MKVPGSTQHRTFRDFYFEEGKRPQIMVYAQHWAIASSLFGGLKESLRIITSRLNPKRRLLGEIR